MFLLSVSVSVPLACPLVFWHFFLPLLPGLEHIHARMIYTITVYIYKLVQACVAGIDIL